MNPPHLTTMIPIDAALELRDQRDAPRRRVRAPVHELDLQPGGQQQPRKAAGRIRPSGPPWTENARRIREHVDSLPIRTGTTPLRVVPEYEAWLVEAMRSGPETPFWKIKGMSVVDHVDDYADVPVLHITGWYDSWTRQVTLNYEALSKAKKSPQRLTIGPWVHGGQNVARRGRGRVRRLDAAVDLLAWRLRWYDHWLKGASNGVDDDPPVLLYIMGTGDDRKSPAGRSVAWRLLACRARLAPRSRPADPVLPPRRRDPRDRGPLDRRGSDDLHLRPAPPRPDDRRQHLVEHQSDDQRCLRSAPPRRHPRRRGPAPPLRAPRRARLPHRAARRRRRGDRHRPGQALGLIDAPSIPTSPPS